MIGLIRTQASTLIRLRLLSRQRSSAPFNASRFEQFQLA